MITFLSPVSEQMSASFPPEAHPYRHLERCIEKHLFTGAAVLDIGCGRTAPNLTSLLDRGMVLYGVDLVDCSVTDERLHLFKNDVCAMIDIPSGSIDIAYSRAVMEHIADPVSAYREIHRVLKPGGVYIFLTPSIYDYGSIIATLVPNRLHPKIVRAVEGRAECDVFPTRYRSNSRRQIERLARASGLTVRELRYMGQYPAYLMFNRVLFWLGSLYQHMIASVPFLRPLQGWIFCVLEKPRDGLPAQAPTALPGRREFIH